MAQQMTTAVATGGTVAAYDAGVYNALNSSPGRTYFADEPCPLCGEVECACTQGPRQGDMRNDCD